MEIKKVEILNMNSIPRKNWEYIMDILKRDMKSMELERVCNIILEDPAKEIKFRTETIAYLLNCPSFSSETIR